MQCLKSLYLHKYSSKDRDPLPEERRLRFKAGHDVGHKAQLIFPGGIDLTPPHVSKYGAMTKYTAELVEKKEPVLYEPVFIYNEVLVALDILVYNNGWHAYEVKSSEKISDTYKEDAALQYYVITSAGIELQDFSIIHLKKHHKDITGGESSEELFEFTSVKDLCIEKTQSVKEKIEQLKRTLSAPGIPRIEMGDQCSKPYDCDFQGFCRRQKALITSGHFRTIDM